MSDEAQILVGGNLLDMLSRGDRARLLAAGRSREVEAGEEVVRQGSHGDCLIVVTEGEIAVVRRLPGDEEKVLVTAKPGMVLGEVAALDGGARSASLRATRRSVLREIGLGAFEAVTLYGDGSGYRILRALAASLHERLITMRRAPAAAPAADSAAHLVPPPSAARLEWRPPTSHVVGVLGALPAFAGLGALDWKEMVPGLGIVDVERGVDVVLPQGSSPGAVIVLRGALSPWLDHASRPEITMPLIGPGDFAEYAAALGFPAQPRRWRARSPTRLLRLDPTLFAPEAPSAARLLYTLCRRLATTLRRSTGLAMHFRLTWVSLTAPPPPGSELQSRTPALADELPPPLSQASRVKS